MVSNLGEYICRGCSGAVYELKVIDQQMENGENGRQQQQQSADSLKVISNELFILQNLPKNLALSFGPKINVQLRVWRFR
jgi:hypothetical protein